MATLRIRYTPTQLPQEICGIICQYSDLSQPDLASLSKVARVFRVEAERILYSFAQLQGRRKIKSFCIAVIRRPSLAARLRRLELHMPPQLDLDVDDLTRITKMLRLSKNLEDLSVHQDNSRAMVHASGVAVIRWILDDHHFKLKSFENSYFQPQTLASFLKEQETLETLTIKCRGDAYLYNAPLPMLKNLDSSAQVTEEFSMQVWMDRKIERIQYSVASTAVSDELATFIAASRFSDTLKSLSIVRKEGHGLGIGEVVTCVGSQLPDLKFLQILDHTSKKQTLNGPLLSPPFLFKRLETLIIRTPSRDYDGPKVIGVSVYRELRTDRGRRRAAGRIMAAIPTLKRLVLIGKQIFEYTADSSIVERLLSELDDQEWLHA